MPLLNFATPWLPPGYLNGGELGAYGADGAVDLVRCDRAEARLLPQQVRHVRRELAARLLVLGLMR